MKCIRSSIFTKSLTTFKIVSWKATDFPSVLPLIQMNAQPFGVCGTFYCLIWFYLLKFVLVFGNSPDTLGLNLLNYAFTHQPCFECLACAKLWALP